MPSVIDLRGGKIVISEKDRRVELSKAELLLSRGSQDVNELVMAKFGCLPDYVYQFSRDAITGYWDCRVSRKNRNIASG